VTTKLIKDYLLSKLGRNDDKYLTPPENFLPISHWCVRLATTLW